MCSVCTLAWEKGGIVVGMITFRTNHHSSDNCADAYTCCHIKVFARLIDVRNRDAIELKDQTYVVNSHRLIDGRAFSPKSSVDTIWGSVSGITIVCARKAML